MCNVRQLDLVTVFLLSPPAKDWLPRRHLSRLEVRVTKQLDSSATLMAYRRSCPPSRRVKIPQRLAVHGKATCVNSNREIERGGPIPVLVHSFTAKDHPDCDTTAGLWRRLPDRIEGLSLRRLPSAFTKVHAEICRHSVRPREPACGSEAWLKTGVARVMSLAGAAVSGEMPERTEFSGESGRRDEHLARSPEAGVMTEERVGIRQLRRVARSRTEPRARYRKTTERSAPLEAVVHRAASLKAGD